MKRFALLGVVFLMFVLTGCQQPFNTKKNSFNNLSQTDREILQDKVVDKIKNNLPQELNKDLTMYDVFKDKNILYIKIKTNGALLDEIKSSTFKNIAQTIFVWDFCSTKNDNEFGRLALLFPNGKTNIYTYQEKEIFSMHVNKDDCEN